MACTEIFKGTRCWVRDKFILLILDTIYVCDFMNSCASVSNTNNVINNGDNIGQLTVFYFVLCFLIDRAQETSNERFPRKRRVIWPRHGGRRKIIIIHDIISYY